MVNPHQCQNAFLCNFKIDIWHNITYCEFKIANESISISLLLEIAAAGLAALSGAMPPDVVVRCESNSGTQPASCGNAGQPSNRVKSSQGRSRSVKVG